MPRARLLKPGFFANEELAECTFESRLLFAGLWTIADREGRLEDRPKRIKGELFPYEHLDPDALLNELAERGFIIRYAVDGVRYIAIPNFLKHQSPHVREPASTIPAPAEHVLSTVLAPTLHQPCPTSPEIGDFESSTNLAPDEHQPSTPHPVAVAVTSSRFTDNGEGSGSSEDAAAAAESYPFRECADLWLSATGTTLTKMVGDAIDCALEDTPPDWVKDAIRETGLAGAKSWKYTAAILERWKHEGREVAPPAADPVSKYRDNPLVKAATAWKEANG